MARYRWLVTLGACVTLLCTGTPVRSQSYAPLLRDLDTEQLEKQGMMLVEDAIQLSRFQQYDWAIPRAKLATQLVPTRYEAWYILGTLYVQQQQLDAGISTLQKAKRIAPKEAGIHSILGSAYFQNQQYELAIAELETALTLNDQKEDSVEVLFDLGNAQFKLQHYDAAIATYEKAIALQEDFWPAINNIGLIHFEQDRIDEAVTKWQEAIAIDPTAAEPQLAVGVATYIQGNRQKGLQLSEAALTLDGRYSELDFLEENLWGSQLLQATETVFKTPRLQALLDELAAKSFKLEIEP